MEKFRDLTTGKKIVFIACITIFFTVIAVAVVEVFSVLLIKKLGWNYEPAYLRIIKGYTLANLTGGRTEDHSWGSWNVSNYSGRIATNCFDVKYKFNSYGARDKERKITGKNRTLIFGDSFTEGWGVEQDRILAAELEKISRREFLNFGVAGSGTGGLNEYVLYKDFAKRFEHTAVAVGFYPGNDFKDNDPKAWQGLASVYYRPFWKLTEDKRDIEIVYYAKKIKGKYVPGLEPENRKPHFTVFNDLREFSAFLNLLTVLRNYKISFGDWKNMQYAYGLDVSDEAITANLIVYGKFSKEIGQKDKYIYVIPAATDVLHYVDTGRRKVSKFEKFKKALSAQGWKIIDLMDAFAVLPRNEIPNYFICDGHWNAKGDRLAAEYIYKFIKKQI